MKKSRYITYLIYTAIAAISLSCVSPEITSYMASQANPFSFTKNIKYDFFTRLEDGNRFVYFGCRYLRDEISFLKSDSGFTAMLNVNISLKRDELTTEWDTVFSLTKYFVSYDSTILNVPESFYVKLPVPPGEYTFYCILSEKEFPGDVKINSPVTIPDPADSVMISTIRVIENNSTKDISFTKQLPRKSGLNPYLEFDVKCDSKLPYRVQLILTKIEADTSSARSIYGLNPFQGSLESRGYKREVTLWEIFAVDKIISESESKLNTFFYSLPDTLREGVYIANVKVITDKEIRMTQEEYFCIFPENFPKITTISEAVKVVYYLASPNEYNKIIHSDSDSVMKNNFESFWLEISGDNPRVARQKIARFFRRVEEANNLFSNYKPGWKTDLGMTYILLGRPEETRWSPSSLQWYYYFDRVSANIPLEFLPIRADGKIIGYYLVRSAGYEAFWYEHRRRWESTL